VDTENLFAKFYLSQGATGKGIDKNNKVQVTSKSKVYREDKSIRQIFTGGERKTRLDNIQTHSLPELTTLPVINPSTNIWFAAARVEAVNMLTPIETPAARTASNLCNSEQVDAGRKGDVTYRVL